ncbi:prepilin-type N-terminal cleavage/methylation domain-containing protein [Thalassotalea mangrovi]|uniref:Prepilin-type N-terminal cleavage/methylation domain-containing protein n=1 Tax=Thalassotalea mangrovi TaxID=2572245 RepID=A0A4U1B333_9GAMM|nr:prepilin-type N-terminal cleavage/methylation domain-containing protein [Thalassotalea mangrovi]TKB44252.1 prepilin-type N-terminal cleavage/methylation domain-containing protein [Thalassotalea mangrovi]
MQRCDQQLVNCPVRVQGRFSSKGFSLLELLIALALFSYIFLGIAKLQLLLAQKSKMSNQQVAAANMGLDLMNKINRNHQAINDYITLAPTTISAAKDCQSAICSRADIARNDLYTIQNQLQSLPFARVKVTSQSDNALIQIFWHPNPAIGADFNCPQLKESDYHCFQLVRTLERTP